MMPQTVVKAGSLILGHLQGLVLLFILKFVLFLFMHICLFIYMHVGPDESTRCSGTGFTGCYELYVDAGCWVLDSSPLQK